MLTTETILNNLYKLHKKNELTNEQKKKLSELYISIKYKKEVKENKEEEDLKHFSLGWYIYKHLLCEL